MKEIDFLPARYRERSQLRRAMLWRTGVLSVLIALVLIAHFAQSRLKNRVARDLAEIQAKHAEAIVISGPQIQRLQTELATSEQDAELFTYLQHPWPRTQLLAAIAQTLPPSLTLTEIQITQPGTVERSAPDPGNSAALQTPSATRDLQKLREEQGGDSSVVIITGKTSDITALQYYVAGFSHSAFFEMAKFESLESLKTTVGPETSQFELRLQVKPAHGQPGGPPIPAIDAARPAANQTAGTSREGRS